VLAVVIAEGVAIVLLGVLVLGLLRSHALILKALHELGAGLELEKEAGTGVSTATTGGAPGAVPVELEKGVVPARKDSTRAHDIIGTTLDREERSVTVTAPGQRALLAFLTSGCSVCETFWNEFQRPVDVPGDGALHVIAKGPAEESPSSLKALAGDLVVLQSSAAWTDYDIPGSPYFVYVEDGRVTGEGSATTWPQVRDLMAQGVADSAEARTAAGRSGPGQLVGEAMGRGERDSLPRMDSELVAAGIRPGHPSLYTSPDPADVAADHGPAHDHHDHHHGHDHGHDHAHDDHHDHPDDHAPSPHPGH
jgi:hypothetical protein